MLRTRWNAGFLVCGLLLLVAARGWCGEEGGGELPVEDFEQSPELTIPGGGKWGELLQYDKAPVERGTSARFSWRQRSRHWLEFNLARPKPLPGFDQKVEGSISFRVFSDNARSVKVLSVRLIDAQNQVFQWRSAVALKDNEWNEVHCRIHPDASTGHWGGSESGVLVPPVRFLGFAVSFADKESTESGSVYIDDITHRGGGAVVDTVRPLWRFDRSELWRMVSGASPDDNLRQTETGVRLTFAATEKEQYLALTERYFELRKLGAPRRISLAVQSDGQIGGIALHMTDSKGEFFSTVSREFHGGANTLVWNLPTDLAPATRKGKNADGAVDYPLSLKAVQVRRLAGQPAGALTLSAAQVEERLPQMEAVLVGVETDNPIRILKSGSDINPALPALTLQSIAKEPLQFTLKAELENFAGEKFPIEKEFRLEPGAAQKWVLENAPAGNGIWYVHYRLIGGENASIVAGKRSYCRMTPSGPTPGRSEGFHFAICTHTERWSEAEQELEVLAAGLCGAKMMRVGSGWGQVEPKEGEWNWQTLDRLVDLYGKQGMELQLLLAFTPQWAAPEATRGSKNWLDWSRAAPRLDAWVIYAGEMARRYGDRVRYIEVWNEPDLDFFKGTIEQYLQMMRTAYEAIKKANPQVQVMTGGFATLGPHHTKKPGFHEQAVVEGVDWYDVHALHEHGEFQSFQRLVDQDLAAIRAKVPQKKPLFFNETAVTSINGAERMQAITLVKKLTFAWARGAIGYTWYDLRNDGFDPFYGEDNFGMVTTDFYPKAVYPTYNELVRLLRGHTFSRQIDLGEGRWCFVFQGKDDYVVCSWTERPGSGEEIYTLETDAASALESDIMGNRATQTVSARRVLLRVGPQPAYLVLAGAKTEPANAQPLFLQKSSCIGVPGKSADAGVDFHNPLGHDAEVQCDWDLSPALGGGKGSIRQTVKAGQALRIPLRVAIPQNTRSRFGDIYPLNVRYKLLPEGWGGTLQIPVHMAARIPAGSLERDADFSVDQKSGVVNACENDPNIAHLTWKGPTDLSMKVWLGREGQALKLRVVVRDDAHVQNEQKPADLWRGDGIQFALQGTAHNGFWEIGLARDSGGKPQVFVWNKPQGASDIVGDIRLQTQRAEGLTTYDALIPLKALLLEDADLARGVRFNLIVNDNDGERREGWVQITSGIGDAKNPELYPFVVFDPE